MPKRQGTKIFNAGVILVSMLVSCGGMQTANFSSSGNQTAETEGSFESAVGGNIQELSISSGTNDLDLGNVSEGEDIVLAVYSYDQNSGSHSFQLGEGSGGQFLQTEEEVTEDLTEQFHMSLRGWEEKVEGDSSGSDGAIQFATKFLKEGDQQTFKVLSGISNGEDYQTVVAELRVQSTDFNFFVDVRDEASFTNDQLQALADQFQDVIPLQREMFGRESDVNGDGRFDVLFTRVVNEMGGSSGGIVTGFFYAIDLFESKKYPVSNEKEMIFVLVPDPSGEFGSPVSTSFAVENILKGVLPHEYQHMISFNQHYFVNGGVSELSWLNEALSHLSEDLYTLDGADDMTGYGLENPARVSSYLAAVSNVCFSCGSSLSQRGGSYLFVKYLYEQAQLNKFPGISSGPELIQALLNTSSRGIDNIIAALFGAGGTDDDFKAVLGNFTLALYFSDSGQVSDDRFQFTGINLRGHISDNRGTFLSGPAVQQVSSLPFTDTLTGTSVSFLKVPADVLSAQNYQLSFNVGNQSEFGAYLIR